MHCQDWVKLHGIRMGRNCCVRSKFCDCGKSIIWYTNSSTARAGCGFRGNIKDTFSIEENVIKHANIKFSVKSATSSTKQWPVKEANLA